MARTIVKMNDKYFLYSTIVDAPISDAMTREKMAAYLLVEYVRVYMQEIEEVLQRTDSKGTSSVYANSAEDTLAANRAGPNEEELTPEGLWKYFFEDADFDPSWVVHRDDFGNIITNEKSSNQQNG